MDDPQKDSGTKLFIILFVFAAPFIYLLGTGPAVLMYDHVGSVGQDVIEAFYQPIEWLVNESSLFERIMRRYIELWR